MAVTISAVQLHEVIGGDLPGAERLLPGVARIVADYAPHAPDAIQNEAVIRLAGYLAQSDYGGIRREEIGPKSLEYTVNHAPLLRLSGAMALLTRYKHRRAGAI